ncbi:ANTAR domain-containing protein [Solimonas sp. K1W22B-7]|uniref:ANTAR domain-containing response regulator n=1 Tax=Solimonas sp. K1W22B-7 TaxID=2303331 RepID=UPI000E330B8C|nr:ANTAR domain-containing protein [Solimonas sp. K1W22B-7]AXQ28418.1 ANTAR domain-containing protein [Solimonas sp. K1W22B-7]
MRVLVVDTRPEQVTALEEVLVEAGFEVLGFISGTSDIYKHTRELQPDAIVISADSPARDTLEHLALIARNTPKPMVMFAANADYDMIREAAVAGVSFYVVPQLSPIAARSLVETAVAHFNGTRQLQRDLETARQHMEERRIVDLAKCRMMEREGLGEAGAYRRMQRMAMESSTKLVEVARGILGKA